MQTPYFRHSSSIEIMRSVFTAWMLLSSMVCAQAQQLFHPLIMEKADAAGNPFPFGVASGDPRQDKVVLWTKIFAPQMQDTINVQWAIARDTTMQDVVLSGTALSGASSAFTVHIEAEGLTQATTYFYRFSFNGMDSPIGRTRTAPENPESLRFAVASCANYEAGYYNGYALIAARNDIDAVIHLGDYIYEGGVRSNSIRSHIPPYEILTLSDYRSRYAQYRLDPDLMEMHRLHPVIATWDDHEVANNCCREGAERHSSEKGSWGDRKSAAMQAYFEWIPVMQPEKQNIIRQFNYGGLADLFMIDGRLQRDTPIEDYRDPARFDTARTKLGPAQTQWLISGLRASKAKWKVIGNNVMFTAMNLGKVAKERQWNMDAWDGYPANRDRIFDALEADSIRNVIVLTGDIHTAWAMDLTRNPHDHKLYERRTGKGVVGAEFVVHSITSGNLDTRVGRAAGNLARLFAQAKGRNPHIRYVNLIDHGYMLLDLSATDAKATWIHLQSKNFKTLKTRKSRAYSIPFDGAKLRRVRP